TEILQHLCQRLHPLPGKYPDHLSLDAGRIRQRAEQVEDGAGCEFDTGRADILHCGMVCRRKHETDSGLRDATADMFRRDVDPDAQRRQHVGRAGTRRQCAIAVLGDRYAGAGDNERGTGRHIHRAGAVAAGPDHVDGIGRRVDAQHLGAHRRYRAGDLIDGFAADAKRHQQSAHLRWRCLAGHHAVKGGSRLLARQCRAGGDFSDDRFEVVHRLLSLSKAAWSEDAPRAVSNHQDVTSAAMQPRGRCSGCAEFHGGGPTFIGRRVQLFAPVTCAKAASLMVVPMLDSSLVTYSAICSSLRERSSACFSFLMSSEAKSIGGTPMSVTRNTTHSPAPAPALCPLPSLAVRKAAAITLAGTLGSEASRLNAVAVSTFNPAAVASSARLPP